MKKVISYFLQSIIIFLFFIFGKLVGIKLSRKIFSFTFTKLGPIFRSKKIIEKNLTNKIYSVVGGGETVSLINSLNVVNNFNFVSTAGGAFLEYLEGKELPGITALKKYV